MAAVFLSTCAVTSQVPTKLQCVGESSGGQLGGPGYPAYVDLGSRTASRVFGPTCCRFCALLDNEDLKCWGGNSNGELGLGDTNHRGDTSGEMGNSLPAVSVGSGRKVASVWRTPPRLRHPGRPVPQVLGPWS